MNKHLSERNLRYIEHFKFAWGAGWVLILAGLASLVHSLLPDVLTGYSERKTVALARLAKMKNDRTRSR